MDYTSGLEAHCVCVVDKLWGGELTDEVLYHLQVAIVGCLNKWRVARRVGCGFREKGGWSELETTFLARLSLQDGHQLSEVTTYCQSVYFSVALIT